MPAAIRNRVRLYDPTDYGPALIRTHRGELVSWGGAAEVVVEDRPDPDKPDRGRTQHTVRGARRYDGVRRAYGEKSPEYVATERFRDDCQRATGATEGRGVVIHTGFDPSRYGPSDAVLDAETRASAAWAAIPASHYPLTNELVIGHMSLDAVEKDRRKRGMKRRKGWAAAELRVILTALMGHYEAVDDGY